MSAGCARTDVGGLRTDVGGLSKDVTHVQVDVRAMRIMLGDVKLDTGVLIDAVADINAANSNS